MSRTTTDPHPQMPPIQLDQDEKRVLAECERESLVYRSIPLGLMTFFATQFAMSRNMITTKGKWIKLSASLFGGYLLGKISYAPTCRKKILAQIPNSNLAHAISGADIQQVQAAPGEHDRQSYISKSSRDPSEAIVFLPDPVDPDTHTVPVGVNQYGDPIYNTTK